jgi:hypothetical protein
MTWFLPICWVFVYYWCQAHYRPIYSGTSTLERHFNSVFGESYARKVFNHWKWDDEMGLQHGSALVERAHLLLMSGTLPTYIIRD